MLEQSLILHRVHARMAQHYRMKANNAESLDRQLVYRQRQFDHVMTGRLHLKTVRLCIEDEARGLRDVRALQEAGASGAGDRAVLHEVGSRMGAPGVPAS